MTEPTPAPAYNPYAVTNAPATNVLAIVSLITSIIGLSIVGIITGHVALGQIRRTGETGHGIALAGTIIGYVGSLLWIIGWIVTIVFWVLYGTFLFSIADTGAR